MPAVRRRGDPVHDRSDGAAGADRKEENLTASGVYRGEREDRDQLFSLFEGSTEEKKESRKRAVHATALFLIGWYGPVSCFT